MSSEPYSVHSGKEVTRSPEPPQAYHEGLEVSPQQHYQQPRYDGNYALPGAPAPKPERTIFGMRRATFFLSVALLVVIIGAAVGGGVGGSLAAKNNSTCAPCSSGSNTVSVTTVTATAASTPTGTSSSVLSVPTGVVALDCPSLTNQDQVISLASQSWTFKPTCGTNYIGADITAIIVYSFRDCLQGCAAMNYFSGNATCAAVTFNANQTLEIPKDYGNCWLKTGSGQVDVGSSNYIISATLTSST
ncbi:hypothetical protein PFICI_00500 [Pestalotiopsis fici W106-1]|uniref:Uncharacterized protein n=1 Tax=Pestalotiopsis fici (strain W106-1 / CGMCC3.15140) TaxID=1229662 RepID=W3XMF5_PESFW|nr:uncharacterized protein PFICI_00500 [Pestalotiopsis fici W106-1]ETS86672.1 hypothetical protein PFICI_00500 [Pestalotiopsis fici W106-1]